MSDKKTITVQAAPGIRMHLPIKTCAAPGARNLMLEGAVTAVVAADDRFIQKRIKKGDLVVVKQTRATKAKADKANESKKTED